MTQLEIQFLQFLESLRTDFSVKLFEGITMLGEETILILMIAVLYFAYDKRLALRIGYITITSMCVNNTVKNLVKRPRPFAVAEVNPARAHTATGYSFPSGHTQTISTWSSAFVMYFKKRWVSVLAGIAIVAVAFSRLFLGVHYPSDVIGGAVLGVSIAVGLSVVYDRTKDVHRLYGITALVLLPVAIWFMVTAEPLYDDFFKLYGMLTGLYFAAGLEGKYAPIEYDVATWKKVLRIVIGVAIVLAVKEGVKVFDVFNSLHMSLLLDDIRYMLVVIVGFGLCPILFKKCNL